MGQIRRKSAAATPAVQAVPTCPIRRPAAKGREASSVSVPLQCVCYRGKQDMGFFHLRLVSV